MIDMWTVIITAVVGASAGFIVRMIYSRIIKKQGDTWPALNFAIGWAISGVLAAWLYVR